MCLAVPGKIIEIKDNIALLPRNPLFKKEKYLYEKPHY